MDFNADMLRQSADNEIKLSTKWLHGAVAKNLRAQVTLNVNSQYTSFPEFDGFMFDDPLKKITLDQEMIVDERVDENGELLFNPQINVGSNSPGMLTANFSTKIYRCFAGPIICFPNAVVAKLNLRWNYHKPLGDRGLEKV